MKKILTLTLCLALLLGLFSGCGGKQYDPLAGVETTVFTDDAGRDVTVPAGITRIAASGSTAQMILMTLVPELLVGLASSPSTAQRPYFPEEMWTLPTFGQFYGSKANLNMEALIDAEPQLIVDLGDAKENVRSDMDGIQKQIMPPAAVDRNIFNMTEEEIQEEGIDVLPNNLLEAVYEMEKDELVKEVLGTHTSRRYIKAKKKEWAEYSRQVSGWELDQYLYRI